MSVSCPVHQWWRRLMTADNVIQLKKTAMLLARNSITSRVSKPKRRNSAFSSSTLCCIWTTEQAGSKSRDLSTILSSHSTTSSTLRSFSSASTRTTTETRTNKRTSVSGQVPSEHTCTIFVTMLSHSQSRALHAYNALHVCMLLHWGTDIPLSTSGNCGHFSPRVWTCCSVSTLIIFHHFSLQL